jgi:hypothetical protein
LSTREVGFKVQPRRWVVERSFAWINRNRRLSKEYDFLTDSSENIIFLAMSRLLLRRIFTNSHYHSTQTFDKIQAEGQEIKSFAENIDLQHGRIERRKIEIIDMPFGYLNGISIKYAKLPEKEKRSTRLIAVRQRMY